MKVLAKLLVHSIDVGPGDSTFLEGNVSSGYVSVHEAQGGQCPRLSPVLNH